MLLYAQDYDEKTHVEVSRSSVVVEIEGAL